MARSTKCHIRVSQGGWPYGSFNQFLIGVSQGGWPYGSLDHINVISDFHKEAGLMAHSTKCHIGVSLLDFLGHIISHGHMTPNGSNIKKLKKTHLIMKTYVRSFISLCGFY